MMCESASLILWSRSFSMESPLILFKIWTCTVFRTVQLIANTFMGSRWEECGGTPLSLSTSSDIVQDFSGFCEEDHPQWDSSHQHPSHKSTPLSQAHSEEFLSYSALRVLSMQLAARIAEWASDLMWIFAICETNLVCILKNSFTLYGNEQACLFFQLFIIVIVKPFFLSFDSYHGNRLRMWACD